MWSNPNEIADLVTFTEQNFIFCAVPFSQNLERTATQKIPQKGT